MKQTRWKRMLLFINVMLAMIIFPVIANASVAEVEPNDYKAAATRMRLDENYLGEIGYYQKWLENFETDVDYYSIDLKAGEQYRFSMPNYNRDFAKETLLIDLIDPRNHETGLSYFMSPYENGEDFYEFTADYTGTYYVKLYNYFDNEDEYKKHPYTISISLTGCSRYGHKYQYVVDEEPTCGEPGSKHEECTVCHAMKPYVSIPATGKHDYESWIVTKSATVFKAGVKERECWDCDKVETKSIPKLKPTIKLSATKKTISKGKTYTLKISKLAKGDSVKSVKSSKKTVATVKKVKTNQYIITGKKKGTAKVTVVLKSGKKATCKVTVKEPKPAPAPAPEPEPQIEQTSQQPEPEPAPVYGNYIANANTGVFHYASCGSVKRMNESNKRFYSSRNDCLNNGYRPCNICHP